MVVRFWALPLRLDDHLALTAGQPRLHLAGMVFCGIQRGLHRGMSDLSGNLPFPHLQPMVDDTE